MGRTRAESSIVVQKRKWYSYDVLSGRIGRKGAARRYVGARGTELWALLSNPQGRIEVLKTVAGDQTRRGARIAHRRDRYDASLLCCRVVDVRTAVERTRRSDGELLRAVPKTYVERLTSNLRRVTR